MSTPRRSCRIAEFRRVDTFTVFPKLPLELQHEIWNLAAQAEADSTPPRIHLFEPDPADMKCELPLLDSNLRYRPKPYYPEIQLRLIHRSHSPPPLLRTCRASREAAKRLYTVWEKSSGGYVYVNKKRDIFFFGHHWSFFWFLRTTIRLINFPVARATYSDQVARLQYMAQLSGCQNIAIDYYNWAWAMRNPLLFLESFESLKTLVLVLDVPYRPMPHLQRPPIPPPPPPIPGFPGPPQRPAGTSFPYRHGRHWPGPNPRISRRRFLMRPYISAPISGPRPRPPLPLRPRPLESRFLMNGSVETKFVVPTEKVLKAGGWTDLKLFERRFDDLRGREEELRISIPKVDAVIPASKDVIKGNWARGLAVYAI
jgi:hypothetical protein